jgi:hypothetical protein
MKVFGEWLGRWSLLITLAFAGLVILFLAPEVASNDVMPYTDGNHYVHRAFGLYGFLHSGQWGAFWNLFTLPRQALAPPQYLLFLLLPRAWAGLASYGFIQLLCNYGVLAVALWNLCRVLERREWAPALFLLCGCENYSFDYPYFFFLDLTFCALTTLALSFQIDAWRSFRPGKSALAGIGVGLLFWIKPANALLFLGTFLLSELFRFAWHFYRRERSPKIAEHLGWFLVGFLPPAISALACGGVQSILLLLVQNELSPEWETHLPIAGLPRLFYFPLCFAYFYHMIVLLVIAAGIALLAMKLRPEAGEKEPAVPRFPTTCLVILLATYAIYGELFSFWFLVKTMRSLVYLLPLFWLFIFWLVERWRVRGPLLSLGAAAYVLVLVSQVSLDTFKSLPPSPDKYYLTDSWYGYFPMAWSRYVSGPPLVAHLASLIKRDLPQGGRVGLTTERVFLDGRSLSLRLNSPALLAGTPPLYSCVRLFNRDGRYSPAAFLSSNVIILYIAKSAQYSQFAWRETTNLLAYVPVHWVDPSDIVPMPLDRGNFLGYQIFLKSPLTTYELDDGMKAIGAPGPMEDDRIDEYIYGRRYTWKQGLDLVHQWLRKRFGAGEATSPAAATADSSTNKA